VDKTGIGIIFAFIGPTLSPKIRTYEKDNCHQPAAYPRVLSNPAIINLDLDGAAIAKSLLRKLFAGKQTNFPFLFFGPCECVDCYNLIAIGEPSS